MNLKRYIDACIRKTIKYKFLDASIFDMFKYAMTGIARGSKASLTQNARRGLTVDPGKKSEGFFEEAVFQINKFGSNGIKKIEEAQRLKNSGDLEGAKAALSSVGHNAKSIKHIYEQINNRSLKGFPATEYNNLFKYINNIKN